MARICGLGPQGREFKSRRPDKMKRLPKLTKKRVISALAVIIISVVSQFFIPSAKPKQNITVPLTPFASSSATVKVTRVIDGDTIEVETGPASAKASAGKQKVRYIGVDTPELHDPRRPVQCYAKEAMEKNKELVEGKNVRLEKDISEVDKFGRLLRYVYIATESSPSGLLVNDYLVKEGYAHAATFPPDVRYVNLFVTSEQEARNNKRGLWQECL